MKVVDLPKVTPHAELCDQFSESLCELLEEYSEKLGPADLVFMLEVYKTAIVQGSIEYMDGEVH
jgi:hypothetical protein